ncbi:Nlrc3 [Symbiodinium sp. CCMP2592]|nr:Nlrc3 [Symbiodinium sp. CCMP2592]
MPSAPVSPAPFTDISQSPPASNPNRLRRGPTTNIDLLGLHNPETLASLLLNKDMYKDVDIKLVRGQYLAAKTTKHFVRRQEAEKENASENVFVSTEDIKKWRDDEQYRSKIRIIALSHVWESMEHPDPTGNQLSILMSAKLWHDEWSWYFIDYMSLNQYPRKEGLEETTFQNSLRSMHVLYSHDFTFTYIVPDVSPLEKLQNDAVSVKCHFAGKFQDVLLSQLRHNVDPYDERGWCQAESQWSRMRTRTDRTFILGHMSDEVFARAPMDPESFKDKVRAEELKFTHSRDGDAVMDLHKTVFKEKAKFCKTLRVMKLPQGEIDMLSNSLQTGLYHNLQLLSITDSTFADQGAEDLAGSIPDLEALQLLILERNRIDDQIASHLAGVLRYVQHVSFAYNFIGLDAMTEVQNALTTPPRDRGCQSLNLASNRICDKSLSILANCLKSCKVVNLNLNSNAIGLEGAKHLAKAISSTNRLRILSLEETNIGFEGAEALAQSLQCKPTFLQLHLANCGVHSRDWWKLLQRFGFRAVYGGSPATERILQLNTHVCVSSILFVVPVVVACLFGLANILLMLSSGQAVLPALVTTAFLTCWLASLLVKAYLPWDAAMKVQKSPFRLIYKPALVWPLAVLSIVTGRCCAGPWRRLSWPICVVLLFMVSPTVVGVLSLVVTMHDCRGSVESMEAGSCALEGQVCHSLSYLSAILGITHGSLLLMLIAAFWTLPGFETSCNFIICRLQRQRTRVMGFCERYWIERLQTLSRKIDENDCESSDELHYFAYMIGLENALPFVKPVNLK